MVCIFRKISLLLENKSKFVSLRKILPIITLLFLTAFSAKSQDSRTQPPQDVHVRVYPNPAQSYITIDLQNSSQKTGLTLTVYSFLGKKMYESQNVQEKTTLTLTEYNRGVYVYHVTDQSGKVLVSGKFQVSR
jgi:hypothetical protein